MVVMTTLAPADLEVTVPVQAPADQGALCGRPLGPHLALGGGLLKAAERARFIGATAVQIFTDNPTAWRRRTEPPPELPAFRERLAGHGIGFIAVHAPYLINLASSEPAMWTRSVTVLASELATAQAYGAYAVNVHIGSHMGTGVERGISQIGEGLRAVLEELRPGPDAPFIVLENSAGQGDGLGSPVEELAAILEGAARAGADAGRIGICLDTRPPVGQRLRPGRSRCDRGTPAHASTQSWAPSGCGCFTSTTPGRRTVRARTATSTSAPGMIGRSGLRTLLTTRAWRTCPPTSRRRAWTGATTR